MNRSAILFGIILNFLSLFLFLYISLGVLNGSFVYLDNAILAIIYSFRDPVMTEIMYLASFLGGGVTLLLATIIVVVLAFKKHKREAALFTFAVLFGYALNNAIKYFLKIPRPDIDPLFNAGFYGFPSGHAMNSFIFYGLLAYFIFHFTRNRGLGVLTAIVSAIIILLVGFSRLYLGVHYPSDVLAGFAAGFWLLTTAILIDKTRTFYKLFKHRR